MGSIMKAKTNMGSLSSIRKKRAIQSEAFFAKNSERFQEQQDLIAKQSSRIVSLESKLQNLEKLEARLDRLEGKSSKVTNAKR